MLLGDWLASFGVTVVGMESTGVYWRPVYYLLEDDFQCWLLNAAHLRNVPGRKTDVADSVWICQLVEHGLVRPSFVPPKPIRELRDLTRYRKALIQERTRKPSGCRRSWRTRASSWAPSPATCWASPAGRCWTRWSREPTTLRCWPSWPRVACGPSYRRCGRRLEGRFRTHTSLLLGELLAHLDYLEEAVERLSNQVARVVAPFSPLLALLITIPGVSQRTAEVILAEVGTDMGQFPSAGHLASWAGICPGNNESAGKHRAGTTRKGSRWLRVALIEAANAAARGKGTYLASQYARLKGRRGHKKAIVAVAHSILVIAWHLLSTGQPYSDLGADWFLQRHSSEAYRNRLVRQLERMGHKVTLEPADAA